MKIKSLFLLSLLSIHAFADPACQIPEGESMGRPIVKAEPNFTGEINTGDCALVSFTLAEARGKYGVALIPTLVKVEHSTNKKLAQAVKEAVLKWKYNAKGQKIGDHLYYSYVPNKTEICQRKKNLYAHLLSGQCLPTSDLKTGKSICASGATLRDAIEFAKLDYEFSCLSTKTSAEDGKDVQDQRPTLLSRISKINEQINQASNKNAKTYPGYKTEEYLKMSQEERTKICAEMKSRYEEMIASKCITVDNVNTGEISCMQGKMLEGNIQISKNDYEFACQL